MERDQELKSLLEKLDDKMSSVGEDLKDHLEGMLYSSYTNYWDYIGVDALLNLQKPKTKYPDEMTFIIYHQISELYFKLIIFEMERIGYCEDLSVQVFKKHLKRINYYFDYLVQSFDVLLQGMDRDQFMDFRKAITPASGFQSIQYRLIELWSTMFINLVSKDQRHNYDENSTVKELYEHIYWKAGATEKNTGKKTLTLIQFEEKYGNLILRKGKEFLDKNLMYRFRQMSEDDQNDAELIALLRELDLNANVNWPLAHYKQAVKYLIQGNKIAKSTGNTNWQQYLPPKFQRQLFYPSLWSPEEIDNWGKSWVEKNVFADQQPD